MIMIIMIVIMECDRWWNVTVRVTDPPSKPGRPDIVDYDRDVAEIHWSPSQHDGGSPIQKYVIEQRELPDHSWHTVSLSGVSKGYGRMQLSISHQQ